MLDFLALIQKYQVGFVLAVLGGLLQEHVQATRRGSVLTLPQSLTAVILGGFAGVMVGLLVESTPSMPATLAAFWIGAAGWCSKWVLDEMTQAFRRKARAAFGGQESGPDDGKKPGGDGKSE